MLVDNDVPNGVPTLNKFYGSPQYRKTSTLSDSPVEIFQCRESIQDIIIYPPINFQCRESIQDIIFYPHIKFWWYRTMLNFSHIVVAILKMANWFLTLKNFYRSLFSKWPPQYRKISTLSDIITIWYVGR
jgi:hypothetical protein